MIKKSTLACYVLTQAMVCTTSFDALAGDYLLMDLGAMGGETSRALGINESGVVVGQFGLADRSAIHAFLYDGAMVDLGALGGVPQSAAFAINDFGDVVGVSYSLGDLDELAARWIDNVPESLGMFIARDVNGAGIVIGSQRIDNGAGIFFDRAVLWSGGVLTPLGTLGGDTSEAFGVNSAGWIVGKSAPANSDEAHGFVWISGGMHDLGTLGGGYCAANDINDAGQIVGASSLPGGTIHAFRFLVDTGGNVLTRTDLGDLGGDYSVALAVNGSGEIVGTSNDRAFIWSGGVLTDLNDCPQVGAHWELMRANDINDAGQIVGEARHHGRFRAFLLIPVGSSDLNGSGSVDLVDHAIFAGCLGGPNQPLSPSCEATDLDFDLDTDLEDFRVLQIAASCQ